MLFFISNFISAYRKLYWYFLIVVNNDTSIDWRLGGSSDLVCNLKHIEIQNSSQLLCKIEEEEDK